MSETNQEVANRVARLRCLGNAVVPQIPEIIGRAIMQCKTPQGEHKFLSRTDMAMGNTVLAWHFVGSTLRDGRPVPPDGEWLTHEGPVKICESGLHASRDPFDALRYAPGPILCRVECDGIRAEHDDKLVCRRRRIVRRIDATDLLWAASRQFALSVIHLWDAPPIVREFLETGDESKRDAAWAATLAAWNDASAAAWNAASAAAWNAARAAAWAALDTAWAAAWNAASNAARAAASAAAWNAQRKRFNAMVEAAFDD